MSQPATSSPARARKRTSFRKLAHFFYRFSNWPEVWSAYRNRQPLPPFHLRNGITLTHGASNDPLYLFGETFEHCEYLRNGFYAPKTGDLIVDIGANAGFFAMYLQSRAPGIRIYCFEPGPDARNSLSENLRLNDCGVNITVYPYAIGAAEGSGILLNASNSMLRALAVSSGAAGGGDSVTTITLAHALELCGDGEVALLKMDIEGGEVELVQGASPSTWSRVKRVAAEVHERMRPGSLQIVLDALNQAGLDKIEVSWPEGGDGCAILRATR